MPERPWGFGNGYRLAGSGHNPEDLSFGSGQAATFSLLASVIEGAMLDPDVGCDNLSRAHRSSGATS